MPLVAIVGRPNVGKSTLFNRFTESRRSIVDDQPGVTRDRIYGICTWNGKRFSVVDTGGFVPRSADRFEQAIREQVKIALNEADLILFVVDVETGITDLDQELGSMLRKAETPVVVAANKADNRERRWNASEFYGLGLEDLYPVSATNGMGSGDLLDEVVGRLGFDEAPVEEHREGRVAIVGRPNVGKSSLVNAILGHERAIVTEASGTTRDATDAIFEYGGETLILVDTAGLRKRARVKENVEFYAALRTERAIRGAEVAVLLLDATRGLENQDVRVLKEAETHKCGLIIAINKWDLVPDKTTHTARDYEELIREHLKTLDYVPVTTLSAKTHQRVPRLLDIVLKVAGRRRRRITTGQLNNVVEEAVGRHPPPSYRQQPVRINYATQVRAGPPVFVFFCRHPQGVTEDYKRYLNRQLRKAFDFEGVPLTLAFKSQDRAA